ncbi:MAG: ABC transporter permease subunit [Planctomycetaceae bacterium]|nr:ABC transporter permease subunit [Planctomycetaceae bacterium]
MRSGYWVLLTGLCAALAMAWGVGDGTPVGWGDAILYAYLLVAAPLTFLGAVMVAVEKGRHWLLALALGLLGPASVLVLPLLADRRTSRLQSPFFLAGIWTVLGYFVLGWLALFAADIGYTTWPALQEVLVAKEIRAALWLSVWTTSVTVLLGLAFAIPMGYALSRFRFPGHVLVDSIVDLPIILPPLLVGLSLLIFFQTRTGHFIEDAGLKFVFQQKGIVLCQFLASASFGIRAVKLTFDGIDPRLEHVAMTLGSTRAGAFFRVALPLARRGIVTGAILIWTRAFGIFGPMMVFVGAVRMRTEVLPTTIYLEQSVGRIEVALAVAVLMLVMAAAGLIGIRMIGLRAE